jgi:hypothetical protein
MYETRKTSDKQAAQLAEVYMTEPEGWTDLLERAESNPMAFKIMRAVSLRIRPYLIASEQRPLFPVPPLPDCYIDHVHGKAVLYARWRGQPDPARSVAILHLNRGLWQLRAWCCRCWLGFVEEPTFRNRPPYRNVLRNAILVRAIHDIAEHFRINLEPDPEDLACSLVAERINLGEDVVAKLWREGGLPFVQLQSAIQARLDFLGIDREPTE